VPTRPQTADPRRDRDGHCVLGGCNAAHRPPRRPHGHRSPGKRRQNRLPILHGGDLGTGWYRGFAKRHPILTNRLAQKLSKERESVTKSDVRAYFYALVQATCKFQCTASNVYNMDETSFKTLSKTRRVVAVHGSNNVWSTEPSTSYQLTVVAAVAADGAAVPPAFILPGLSCETTVLDKCPVAAALVTTSAKAFINAEIVAAWLTVFAEWKMAERGAAPAVLVVDNCSSHHMTYDTVAIGLAYGIRIVYLPANSTHLLQPLDVSVFRSFKSRVSRLLTTYVRASASTTLPRDGAIRIAGVAFNDVLAPKPSIVGQAPKKSAAENGFRTCGAWPLSLPAMFCRLDKVASNGVRSTLGTELWLRTRDVVREEVLVVPSFGQRARERKRVVTDSTCFSSVGLHNAATVPTKKKVEVIFFA